MVTTRRTAVVPRRTRTKFTYLPSLTSVSRRRRAVFKPQNLPPNFLTNLMRRLSTKNVASARLGFAPRSEPVRYELERRRRGQNLKQKLQNFNRHVNPAYVKVVSGLRKYYPNNEPINNWGTNVGYHARRVNSTQKMLNTLTRGNNGYYHTPAGNKYSFVKRYGGSLSTVPNNPQRASVVFVTGIKRTPNGRRLKFKY